MINEQDRLIHDALMSKLPNNSEKWVEDFEFQPKLTDNMGLFSPVYGIFSPKMLHPGRLSVNGRYKVYNGIFGIFNNNFSIYMIDLKIVNGRRNTTQRFFTSC